MMLTVGHSAIEQLPPGRAITVTPDDAATAIVKRLRSFGTVEDVEITAARTFGPYLLAMTLQISAETGTVNYEDAEQTGAVPDLAVGVHAGIRLSGDVWIITGDGVPVDFTDGDPVATGDGYAGTGSLYIRTATGKHYVNSGTKAEPTWGIVTSA